MDITTVALIFVTLFLTILVVLAAKNERTYHLEMLFIEAIDMYQSEKMSKGEFTYEVEFDDLEKYMKTFFRMWDWGYTRMLPPEKLEIILPYVLQIKRERKNG